MTTNVKIQSHNYPVRVEIWDHLWQDGHLSAEFILVSTSYLWPEHGEQTFYATTTRKIIAIDVEYDDVEALKHKP